MLLHAPVCSSSHKKYCTALQFRGTYSVVCFTLQIPMSLSSKMIKTNKQNNKIIYYVSPHLVFVMNQISLYESSHNRRDDPVEYNNYIKMYAINIFLKS